MKTFLYNKSYLLAIIISQRFKRCNKTYIIKILIKKKTDKKHFKKLLGIISLYRVTKKLHNYVVSALMKKDPRCLL